ncbi:MAG: AAA family ATPase [Clostridia bacterium]|nr:AAA family ATPase [Clostridia bacterium]
MILTTKQEQGLKIAVERHKNGEKYTVISGYAGTGKSTLVRFIISALDVDEGRVCYTAFTGKAAEVLRKKGNKNVSTLHRLLYESIPREAGGFFRRIKPSIPYDIIIVDECSMAPKELIDILLKHKVYIIFLGDPFQLPPIDKENDNHLLDNPHVFLDEIMRQAQESEIIRLTMKIRNQEPLSFESNDTVKILHHKELTQGMYGWADQILTGTNATRAKINAEMRTMLGKGAEPEAGDKVICTRNYWEDCSICGDPLINGSIGYLVKPNKSKIYLPWFLRKEKEYFDVIKTEIEMPDTGDIYPLLNIDYNMLQKEIKSADWRLEYKLGKMRKQYGDLLPKDFLYAYAITVHKAQGSEWDKVLVYEENFPFNRTEHARWLYTAATRAADKLVILRE